MKIGLLASPFNPIQPGHLWAIKQALQAGVCDGVLAAVNATPNHGKPNKRPPIWTIDERLEMVECIPGVAFVIPYWSEDSLYRVIKAASPAVLIVGEDHRNDPVTGADLGIPIFWAKRRPGWSSTEFVDAIYEHELDRRLLDRTEQIRAGFRAMEEAVQSWVNAKCPCRFPEWDGTQTGGNEATVQEFGGSQGGAALIDIFGGRDAKQTGQGVSEARDQENDRELQA